GPYILELEGTDTSLVVTVFDSSVTLPRVFPRDPERVGRHGLEIVRALADNVTVERFPVGKCVRAELNLADGWTPTTASRFSFPPDPIRSTRPAGPTASSPLVR